MNQSLLATFALLLSACNSDVMSFGLDVRHRNGTALSSRAGGSCYLPGSAGGESAVTLATATGAGDLWLAEELDADADTYRVRVYVATDYRPGTQVAQSPVVLAERQYVRSFGEAGERDSFEVEFEEEEYVIEVTGVPTDGDCPAPSSADLALGDEKRVMTNSG